ncbi:hypothetical protein FACS1894211_13890 [Clostridia bacterium]|nr:hypothetical protein FACS1894211_13890 [Clostridia bacterium]
MRMNKLRKLAAFLCCALVVFGFAGCVPSGGDPGGTDPSDPLGQVDPGGTDPSEPGDDLFTESVAKAYNYCPSILQTDENTRYMYYCANPVSEVVEDHAMVRRGTRVNGRWTWSEKQIALAPTPGKYDSLHICDPSVIQGKFSYNSTEYKYLMAYTGNNYHIFNKVGLAVSNDLMSGWVKVENPFVTYWGSTDHWGVGQPTLVSVDKEGRVMLFYAVGSTYTGTNAERWDLSDLNHPVREYSIQMTVRGLTTLTGASPDTINNIDVAYDPVRKRYYAVSECHPNPQDEPNIMGSHVRVTYIGEPGAVPGDLFASVESMAVKSWSTQALIGPNETGFPRNHNAGLVTDPYGWMLPGDTLSLYYSMSMTGDNYSAAWTYRIYNYELTLSE